MKIRGQKNSKCVADIYNPCEPCKAHNRNHPDCWINKGFKDIPESFYKEYWKAYWSMRWVTGSPKPKEKKVDKTRSIYMPSNRLVRNPRTLLFNIAEEIDENDENLYHQMFSEFCQLRTQL